MKKDVEGQLLQGICNNKELTTFMNLNGIQLPEQLKEFFVDSCPEDLDPETLDEFNAIFESIKTILPIYKETKEEIKEVVFEEKEHDSTFVHIITNKHITFIDFDNKQHEAIQKIDEEKYNLDGVMPVLTEVKREQSDKPRGEWFCYKYQFETHYYLVKYYLIKGERKRVQIELRNRYERKDGDVIEGESRGEDYKLSLEEKYINGCCQEY